ncbi:MAG TPA: isocitrate lyase/phosphoenolpyruvate mutase family protein [Edaphobacter sp.]|nr:isocitrate lyase/phosphoenolpyruvate mutase family protein [Edaphobacter sp.]
MTSIAARRDAFRKLHEEGCFILPNPWDIGSARYLRSLGFKALATTSGGFAFSHGLPDDGAVTRDLMLAHITEMVASVDLPINADFQSGYAGELEELAENVRLCAQTGVAALSIEDSTGDREEPIFEFSRAVERIRTAKDAIQSTEPDVLLVGRAECFLLGHPDPLPEAIRRLEAFAEAGADVLYAPGAAKRADVEAIVKAVAPKPVNVLLTSSAGLSIAELADLGVRRISVGSALARAAWTRFIHAAREMAEHNSMAGLDNSVNFAELDGFFRKDLAGRK